MLHETTLAAWLRDGPRLVRGNPTITTVSPRGKVPLRRQRGGWQWRRGKAGHCLPDRPEALPPDIFDHLPPGVIPDTDEKLPPGFYVSDFLAVAGLSAALLAWARARTPAKVVVDFMPIYPIHLTAEQADFAADMARPAPDLVVLDESPLPFPPPVAGARRARP